MGNISGGLGVGRTAKNVGTQLVARDPGYLLNTPYVMRGNRSAASGPLRDHALRDFELIGEGSAAADGLDRTFNRKGIVHSAEFSNAKDLRQQQCSSRPTCGTYSIANMATKPDKSTPESRRIKAAVKASGKPLAAVAESVGVSSGVLSQWAGGHRPVPAGRAVPLAQVLGLEPGAVSAQYRAVEDSQQGSALRRPRLVSEDEGSDTQIARLSNDFDAMKIAFGIMVASMVKHRPIEARESAAALRRHMPASLRDNGLLRELVEVLEQAR